MSSVKPLSKADRKRIIKAGLADPDPNVRMYHRSMRYRWLKYHVMLIFFLCPLFLLLFMALNFVALPIVGGILIGWNISYRDKTRYKAMMQRKYLNRSAA